MADGVDARRLLDDDDIVVEMANVQLFAMRDRDRRGFFEDSYCFAFFDAAGWVEAEFAVD